jgi:hypothetical protein
MQEAIQQAITFFKGNPIFNIISFSLAIIGIILSFYFYHKGKRSRIPTYMLRTINLVKEGINKIERVEILFSGKKINNLSITKIALWNDGKETINQSDVAANDPLKIIIDNDFEILDAEIIFKKNTANDFKIDISENKKSVNIEFDYFDYEEGIVMQLSHTGPSSSNLKIVGTVKTVKKIVEKEGTNRVFPSFIYRPFERNAKEISIKLIRNAVKWAFIILGILFLALPFFATNDEVRTPPKESTKFIISLLGLPYLLIGLNMLRRKTPKGFNVFNEEFDS